MKKLLLTIGLTVFQFSLSAQTHYDMQKIQKEKLDRGVVAVTQNDGSVFLSWRMLSTDRPDEAFDIYRDGRKINTQPLKAGGTFFIDRTPATHDADYRVVGGGVSGEFRHRFGSPAGYFSIPLDPPTSDMRNFRDEPVVLQANDASIGDVDGDGQYEIILKWDPTNAHDNAHSGLTECTYFDCYKLDGTRLWRINMGKNIRSGAHYIPFLVYDFDGDGKAEFMVKTADGTIDGKGKVIGDATKDWRTLTPGATLGRIMDGSEYLTVFNGRSGAAMATVDYVPDRGENGSWGDRHGNRSERYLAALAYLDGIHPSAVFCRGYYTRSVLAAWDWDGKKLTQHWVFDTNNPEWAEYAGQGNHNLRVADVDGDGCDEIAYGSMTVDHNGRGLYNLKMGHGDDMHLVPDPQTDRLYIWDVHENKRDGSELHDAATGEIIFQKKASFDVGRGMAADIDPTHEGMELWSANTGGLLDMKGNRIVPSGTGNEDTGEIDYSKVGRPKNRLSCNFAIWWDGDLTRELLDHERVTKYEPSTGKVRELIHFDGRFNNWTKSNPCLSGDILGDWREEVIIRSEDSKELRIYTTTIPTEYRVTCLEEDIPYRESVANENVGYNQPPEMGKTIRAVK